MEVLGVLIALGVLAFLGLGTLFGWIAYIRLGKLERRLEHRLHELERAQVAARAADSDRAVPRAEPAPRSTPATAPTPGLPADVRPASRATPTDPTPIDATPSHGVPARTTPSDAQAAGPAQRPAWTPAPPIPAPGAEPIAAATVRADGPRSEPAAPSASVPPAPPERPAAKPFEWERWLGVRGAAVLGGVFLAIAGFLFLQHSIERGWITPLARVVSAVLGGSACFVVSSPLRRRGYAITANALAGAGAVVLYAAWWAASMLYGFVSPLVAFAAMGGVTALCVYVAWKHGSQLVAVLGLVGGFATPLVLSTGQDRPIGLFGYVLLLDLAFLFLSGRRRWPALGTLALVGTTILQGVWVLLRMDPGESWIGLAVLGIFALAFAGFATTREPTERKSWIPAQTGAVLLPFAFVVYFAQSLALAIPLGALVLLAGILCAAAGVLARRDAAPWLPIGAAAGSTALLFTWSAARPAAFDAGASWLVAGSALGIAALQHAFAEWRRADRTTTPGAIGGAATSAIGALVLAAYAALDPGAAQPWPWIAAFAVAALALQRQAVLADAVALTWAGTVGAGMGLALQRFVALEALDFERDVAILAAIAALGLLLLAAAHGRRSAARAGAFAAAAGYFAPATLATWSGDMAQGTFVPAHILAVGAALVLAVGALAAATGARSGASFLLAALAAFLTQAVHVFDVDAIAASTHWATFAVLLVLATALFAAWPPATRAAWRENSLAWCVASVQTLAWVLPVAALVEARFTDAFAFATPLAFAAGTGLLAWALWRAPAESAAAPREVQRRARIAATMVALLFASSVVPMQVDREPAAVTLALWAAALAAFWARFDSRAVKWAAVTAVAVALLALSVFSEPWIFAVPPRPIANVHAWMYLVPAACAAYAAGRFRGRELERLRGFEREMPGRRQPIAAGISGLGAVVLVFVWLNVEISARFAIGETVTPYAPHEPGRALATSLGWAAYALVLLALGVRRQSSGPRWASLVLFLGTSAKVFLFDLGHLEGLHRAASMLGLALSLIAVSLVYQRFVFRRTPVAAGTPPESTAPAAPEP